jgi:repressor LexA
VYEFILEYTEGGGYPPTVAEIASHFGIWPRAAKKHLVALERKGYLNHPGGGARRAIGIVGRMAFRAVPVVGDVPAGRPILAVENVEGSIALDRAVAKWEGVFLLRVRGNSMLLAGIFDGDYVLVKPQSTAENGEIVVALLGDEATVKRFFRTDRTVRLEPANPDLDPIVLEDGEEKLQIVGRVVALLRMLDSHQAELMPQ